MHFLRTGRLSRAETFVQVHIILRYTRNSSLNQRLVVLRNKDIKPALEYVSPSCTALAPTHCPCHHQVGRTQPRLFTIPLFGPRIPPPPLRVPPPAHALALRTIPRDRLRKQTPAAVLRLAPGRAQAAHGLPHLPPQGAHAEVAVRGPHVGDDPPQSGEHVCD